MPQFVTFTPNPAVDVSTAVAKLEDAHKMRCDAPQTDPGGGGINVARVLRRLGADVLALYPAGGANGQRLHGLLEQEGVRDEPLTIAQETRESFTVQERESGCEYRFVLPGPALAVQEWTRCLERLRSLPCAWIVSSGSLPPGVPEDGHAQVARLAREHGARMVLDASGPALRAALEEGVWLVKPSLRELSWLSDLPLTTPLLQQQAARRLIDLGQAEVVALSLGAQGAMLVTAQACLHADALPVKVSSSVGAGDSFLAALVWALDQHGDPHRALASAVAAGAAAVMHAGTALCQPQDMLQLQGQVRLRMC